MLARRELEPIANTLTHGNVGHAETLYLQDIVLSTISRETADELVFKGGTALMKFYQLDRFSDDLDFTAREAVEFGDLLAAIVRDLDNYGAAVAERTEEETDAAYHARLVIEGSLYTGERRSLAFLRVEVNKGSTVSRFGNRRYTPQFPDVPSFELAVLDEVEILAEKIRALLTRDQPRDLYDIYHLLSKSVRVEPALVQEKLDYYDQPYDPDAVLAAVSDLESNWAMLETLTYTEPPEFAEAIDVLADGIDEVR
jgi:predicted nucleotidyltransferase component of viral defense system